MKLFQDIVSQGHYSQHSSTMKLSILHLQHLLRLNICHKAYALHIHIEVPGHMALLDSLVVHLSMQLLVSAFHPHTIRPGNYM